MKTENKNIAYIPNIDDHLKLLQFIFGDGEASGSDVDIV